MDAALTHTTGQALEDIGVMLRIFPAYRRDLMLSVSRGRLALTGGIIRSFGVRHSTSQPRRFIRLGVAFSTIFDFHNSKRIWLP